MINDAADYQFITPVGNIDGGILPARDVAADGSKLTLRAEDLCFGIEALNERMSLSNYSPSPWAVMPSPSLVVKRNDWIELWHILQLAVFNRNDNGNTFASDSSGDTYKWITAIDPSAVFADADFPEQRRYWYLNTFYPSAVLSSRYADGDRPGYVWHNDFIRGFYYDLQRADRLLLGGKLWPISGTVTVTDHDIDTNTSASENVRRFHRYAYFQYASKSGGGYKRKYHGYTGGSMTFTLPLHNLATSAELLVMDEIYWTYRNSSEGKLGRFHRHTLTWDSNGVVTIPAAAWQCSETDLEGIAAGLNLDLPFTTSAQTIPGYLNLIVEAVWLVVRYDFRTEIRSLNWQWTP